MRMGTNSRAMTIIMNSVTTKNRRMGAVNTSPTGIRNSSAGITMAMSHFNQIIGERLVASMFLSPFFKIAPGLPPRRGGEDQRCFTPG